VYDWLTVPENRRNEEGRGHFVSVQGATRCRYGPFNSSEFAFNGRLAVLCPKVQIKGFSDLFTASSVVGGIHSSFASRPHYVNGDDADFLEKYPLISEND
jgi:hypothetical protein